MNILIVEDDLVSQRFLKEILKPYGECSIVPNGIEAVKAFVAAHEEGRTFNLICLDIMMPEMDGQVALRKIREYEESQGILSHHGVKIIMTTALDDPRDIMDAFMSLCDGYLKKPISKEALLDKMKELGVMT